jgi:5'-deoxynucleotidase YfbR-like HD superfamily hydrolase
MPTPDWRPSLFDRVRLARESAEVERCHAYPHLMRYSVGHHSLGVVHLVTLAWADDHHYEFPSAHLLVTAAFHDASERVLGDIPSDVREWLGEARFEAVERRVADTLGVGCHLTDEEQLYLNAADKFELWLWCWEEGARGNKNFTDWLNYYDLKWRKNPLPPAFMELVDEVYAAKGVHRLPQAARHKAGGLMLEDSND